jgi:nucleoside-diphosphate-sugar epimerase
VDPVFVTGGTGYIGRALIDALRERGYIVHALVRPGSEAKLPSSALPVLGNALDASTFASAIPHVAPRWFTWWERRTQVRPRRPSSGAWTLPRSGRQRRPRSEPARDT